MAEMYPSTPGTPKAASQFSSPGALHSNGIEQERKNNALQI